MSVPLQRFRIGAFVLIVTVVVAVAGYRVIGGRDWIDSLYMVVITVSSVGYTDDPQVMQQRSTEEKLLTIVVIVVGLSAAAYTVGALLQIMTEGEIQRALGLRRISREIKSLRNHIVVCGYGRTGHILAEELQEQRLPFIVIDHEAELIAEAQQSGLLAIKGDATEEDVLLYAGVDRAKSLVSALASDADNVFITLTSRNLNPEMQIIARGDHPTTQKKLEQAGADRVVLPTAIGARRMAAMISRPSTVELLELFTDRTKVDVEMDEVHVPQGCPLVGKTVELVEARRRHRLLFVAVKRSGGEMIFNPDATLEFAEGDTIIVMGKVEDAARFRQEYGL